MSNIKIKKHGNSYGITLPSKILKEASLGPNDELELIVHGNVISIFKKKSPTDQWKFPDPQLNEEDKKWIDADLGGVDEER